MVAFVLQPCQSKWPLEISIPEATEILVPKKGLEPPRPCGHMDLNHARLPIPPLRLGFANIQAKRLARDTNYTVICINPVALCQTRQAVICH